MNIDPRLSVIEKRLSRIGRILVFCSGKGGVGKSLCSSAAALILADQDRKVGLLDMDFYGASTHLFLGAPLRFPQESGGILPLSVTDRLGFMSICAFTGERAVPLRGEEVSNALLELLAVTVWDDTDYLIVDMPPGIGDEVLDLIRFMKRAQIVVVSSASVVSVRVVERLLSILVELKMDVAGIIENYTQNSMQKGLDRAPDLDTARDLERTSDLDKAPGLIKDLSRKFSVPLLGSLPYFSDIEEMIGARQELLNSGFSSRLKQILSTIVPL
jgi:ATP-binding protein involved in chromosome partitioning